MGVRDVRIEDDHIVVSPFDAQALPPSGGALAGAVTDRLSLVDLPDLLGCRGGLRRARRREVRVTDAPAGTHTALRRVVVDTNVVLDVLLERPPFVADAARLLAAVVERRVIGVLAGHAVTTVYYVYRRGRPRGVARQKVAALLSAFEVAPVGRAELEGALASPFADYDDGVVHAAAVAAQADAIVTGDGLDFGASTLPVCTPAEMLAVLTSI